MRVDYAHNMESKFIQRTVHQKSSSLISLNGSTPMGTPMETPDMPIGVYMGRANIFSFSLNASDTIHK